MDYHIRWSRPYRDLSGAIAYIERHSTQLVVVEHEADDEVQRTHIHMYVVGLTCTKETLKNQFKKAFPGVDKSDYIHKTTYEDRETKEEKPIDKGLMTYMSKGSLEPSYIKGITMEEYKEYMGKWVNYENKKFNKGDIKRYVTVKENPKEKKLRKQDLLAKMITKCANDYSHENVRKAIKEVIIDSGEILGVYKMIDYYDTIMMRNNANRFDNMFDNIISRRLN